MQSDSIVDREEYKVFRLGRITFLPHYILPGAFVGPGYGRQNFTTYTERELMERGAVLGLEFLWNRAKPKASDKLVIPKL